MSNINILKEKIGKLKKEFHCPDFGPDGPDNSGIETMNFEQEYIGGWNKAIDAVLELF